MNRYNNYQYYFGVAKADSYGHNGIEIANHLDTITYEVLCSIGKRVPRVYIK